jgi:Type I phosphodiesterase / nucleotide pyrophosphatase
MNFFSRKRVFEFVLPGQNGRSYRICLAAFCLLLLFPFLASAQIERVVIIKCDGLPYEAVDRFVHERDPRTGKSQLPWFDYVFYQQGVRLRNFYVRGMSLSAPSWSLLETGQHLRIKGNVEFDRYTMHTYDYLNFIPYVVNTTVGSRVDMPAVEVLDSVGEPLLIDAYRHDERYLTFSLFQRGPRFITYQKSLENHFKRAPKELFDEWTMGFSFREAIPDQLVRELIQELNDPKIQYLDVVLADYDHAAHHNNDRESHLIALKRMDSVLGQVWTAIQKAPLGDETALILVSDHGFNSDERVYSQGYNLVKFLGSPTGGGHHVITKRRLMLDYSIKSMNPFVNLITTTSSDSFYLKGKSTDYPTAMLDFDGNERASIHLRNSDLNLIHILLDQLQTGRLAPAVRKAATDALFQTIDANRPRWQATLDSLNAELTALRRKIEEQRKIWAAQPKKFSKEELEAGKDDESKRVFAQLDRWISLDREYTEYVRVMSNLLALRKDNFEPAKIKVEDVINIRSMGDRNSVFQLQNYIVGLSDSGLTLKSDGSLDLDKSLRRINYFSTLHGIAVRNNVQPGVSNRPIDLIAIRLSSTSLSGLNEPGLLDDVVWVYGGPDKQALILARNDQDKLSLRYLPIKNLTQDSLGQLHFEAIPWQPGLPLHMLEDAQLALPTDNRELWLQQWHTDTEWLHALHKTEYSNGLIGLFEELGQHPMTRSPDESGISTDEQLRRRLVSRQRQLIESDMLVVANNHWNFDVRGFNPGGNHGSFFRISTHSTLMFAGGEKTYLPRARVVDEPYDSLSFVPTVLAITGKLRDDSSPLPALWDKGFRKFPGRVIREVLPETPGNPKIAITGEAVAP